MEKEEIVVGIDVGTTKIAVFIGKRDEAGKISIIGMGKTPSIGVERGVVKNIEATANSIKQAVGQAEASKFQLCPRCSNLHKYAA